MVKFEQFGISIDIVRDVYDAVSDSPTKGAINSADGLHKTVDVDVAVGERLRLRYTFEPNWFHKLPKNWQPNRGLLCSDESHLTVHGPIYINGKQLHRQQIRSRHQLYHDLSNAFRVAKAEPIEPPGDDDDDETAEKKWRKIRLSAYGDIHIRIYLSHTTLSGRDKLALPDRNEAAAADTTEEYKFGWIHKPKLDLDEDKPWLTVSFNFVFDEDEEDESGTAKDKTTSRKVTKRKSHGKQDVDAAAKRQKDDSSNTTEASDNTDASVSAHVDGAGTEPGNAADGGSEPDEPAEVLLTAQLGSNHVV